MSKITRETMTIFGSSAGSNQIEQFGSLAAGSPNYVTPGGAAVATIQGLAAWLEGWYGGIVGADLPAIQDLNAICYVYAYQLAYIFQAGIPEYDAGTTYYTGSFCNSAGQIYVSLTNGNIGNAVTNPTYWQNYSAAIGSGLSLNATTTTYNTAGTYTWVATSTRCWIEACGGGGAGGVVGYGQGTAGQDSTFNGKVVGVGAVNGNQGVPGSITTTTGSASGVYSGGGPNGVGAASPFYIGGVSNQDGGAYSDGGGGGASDYGPGGTGGYHGSPPGLTPISTAYGAGGGGPYSGGSGGAGVKKFISVFEGLTIGASYTVVVGAGGVSGDTSIGGYGMNGIVIINA